MQEVFYEESAILRETGGAKTKFYIFKTFSIVSYVFAVLWLILFIWAFDFGVDNVFINLIIALLPLAMFIASGILLGRFKDKFYIDYDYTFVTGTIRFSKVIKNYKRKNIVMFDTSLIERIGKYDTETYKKYTLTPGLKVEILTGNITPSEGRDFYYIVANIEGNKRLFLLECSETFLVNVLKFTKRTVLDEGFKK